MVLSQSPSDAAHSAAMGAMTGGIGGAVSGTMQWLVMRQEDTSGALWLLASIVGWGVAFAAAWSTAWFIGKLLDVISTYAVIGIIVGSLGGSITGLPLVLLLRYPTSDSPMTTSA